MLEALETLSSRLRTPPLIPAEVEKIRECIGDNKNATVELEKLQPSFEALRRRGQELIGRSQGADKDLAARGMAGSLASSPPATLLQLPVGSLPPVSLRSRPFPVEEKPLPLGWIAWGVAFRVLLLSPLQRSRISWTRWPSSGRTSEPGPRSARSSSSTSWNWRRSSGMTWRPC